MHFHDVAQYNNFSALMDLTFLAFKGREKLAVMPAIEVNVLSRKGVVGVVHSNRTANRHRWTSVSMLR